MIFPWMRLEFLYAPDGLGGGGGIDEGDVDADGFNAFMADITGEPVKKKEPAEKPAEKEQEVEEVEPEPEPEDADDTDPEEADEAEAKADPAAGDDTEIVLKIGDKEQRVKLSDLTAVYASREDTAAQTAANAQVRAQAAEQTTRATTALKTMLERAQAAYKPYEDLDYLKLSRQLDEASWDQLRKDALAARSQVEYLNTELTGQMQAAQRQQQAHIQERARHAVAVLSGPEDGGGVKGWSQSVYNETIEYAVKEGLPREIAHAILEPAAIRLLHRAMVADRANVVAAAKVTKVKSTPSKVSKPSPHGTSRSGSNKAGAALARLQKSGSDEDGAAAFLASFGDLD